MSTSETPGIPTLADVLNGAASLQSFDGSAAPTAVTLPATRFAVYKATLADPGAAWMKLPGLAGEQGLLGESTRAWSIIPTLPSTNPPDMSLPYLAAFTLADGAHPSGEIEEYTSPGGKYVMAAHRGPYEGLAGTWGRFAGFVFHNANVDSTRPAMEHYFSDPGNTKPEDLVTLLFIPIN
jgi:AraC family transcriptional regulator